MAFDETLADRLRTAMGGTDWVERRMFGGLAFMVAGQMACGVVGDELMVRLGEDGVGEALRERGVRAMDFTGKPIRTMAFVTAEGVRDDAVLAGWVARALAYTATLPPK